MTAAPFINILVAIYDEAKKIGRIVISAKNDWNRVFTTE
jgi:hypothetical protein